MKHLAPLLLLALLACRAPEPTPSAKADPPTPAAPQPEDKLSEGASLPYTLPHDGNAEVARYELSRLHYGIGLQGRATMLTVEERIHRDTYVKSSQADASIPALKLMLIKDLPSMNWDHHDNLALYSTADLQPLRLAITADEWCGNNYMEMVRRGEELRLLGRSYVDDTAPVDAQAKIAPGTYFYEQVPVLVRAMLDAPGPVTLRVLVPQSAYLAPDATVLELTLTRKGDSEVTVPAGRFSVVEVEVTSKTAHPRFPGPERYWIDKGARTLVQAERWEVHTQFGKLIADLGSYRLLSYHRAPYWEKAAPPATLSLTDRRRATYDAEMEINFFKVTDEKFKGGFDFAQFLASDRAKAMPAEYLSDPKGKASISTGRDNTGGWFYDESQKVWGKPGRFVPNVPPSEP